MKEILENLKQSCESKLESLVRLKNVGVTIDSDFGNIDDLIQREKSAIESLDKAINNLK